MVGRAAIAAVVHPAPADPLTLSCAAAEGFPPPAATEVPPPHPPSTPAATPPTAVR